MNEKLKQFFVRLVEDPKFREEFSSTQSAMEGYIKAKPYIDDVSFEEFKQGLRIIHDRVNHGKGLDDHELKNVSGGANIFDNMFNALKNMDISILKDLFES